MSICAPVITMNEKNKVTQMNRLAIRTDRFAGKAFFSKFGPFNPHPHIGYSI